MKRTAWYPGHIKPVRPGVYERWDDNEYSRWNGVHWFGLQPTVEDAARETWIEPGEYQNDCWRGLTTKDGK